MPGSQDHALKFGLAPIANRSARALILGSMPSERSLERQQYYGHPQNAFWPIMARLFDFDPQLDYTKRCSAVKAAGLAIWDVVRACVRPGSLDAAIDRTTVQVNDFDRFLQQHRSLRAIFFNGAGAETLFKRHCRHIMEDGRLPVQRLPSTSPAHAAMTRDQKYEQWRTALMPVLQQSG